MILPRPLLAYSRPCRRRSPAPSLSTLTRAPQNGWAKNLRGRLRSLRRRGERVARAGRLPVREGSSPSRRHAMWTAQSRALVGDFGAGQALSDERYALLAPLLPPAKPGGRPRTTDMRRLLDGLFYLVRTGCQWRHLPPPPAFPPWRTVYGYMRA